MAKKLLPILLLLLHCALLTLAQNSNFGVESFVVDENDQTARVTNKQRDQNNKICALVKVETTLPLKDFFFDGGMAGVVHTEQKTGEIWVYLPVGAQRITIKHEHLGIIRNYPFGESLKEATVYIMKLKTGNVRTVVEENVALQYFVIRCAVDGATVKIDDAEPEPLNKGQLRKSLSYGKHRYVVEAPMYHPMSGVVSITAEKAAPVDVQLKPMFGTLNITTAPEQDADVFLDGERRGKTPLTLEKLKSGEHKLRITKMLYLSHDQNVVVVDGETTQLPITLKPNFADITLTAADGGDIYVNDELKGANRWQGRLTPGAYKVELRKAAHRSTVESVEVKAGQAQNIALRAATPIHGTLDVETGDVEADVYIDGVKQQHTTPSMLNRILVGKHVVEFRAKGYKSLKVDVEVVEGKIIPVKQTLSPEVKTPTYNAYTSAGSTNIGYTSGKSSVASSRGAAYPKKTFLSANFSWSPEPQMAYGLTIGGFKRVGWYASFMSNFNFEGMGTDYVGDYDGEVDGYYPFYSGNTSTTRISATIGFIGKVARPFAFYAGAGYGYRALFWETTDGVWVQQKHYSKAGVDVEGGFLFDFNGFILSTGIVTTNFERWELKFCVGYAF